MFPCPSGNSGVLKGQHGRDSRRPVLFEMLLRLEATLTGLCFLGFESLLFRLAFLLTFFVVFRIPELVAPSQLREGGL